MGLVKYAGRKFREMAADWKAADAAYLREYQRCFEGTPEQVERRLEAWDWTHRVTRQHYRRY